MLISSSLFKHGRTYGGKHKRKCELRLDGSSLLLTTQRAEQQSRPNSIKTFVIEKQTILLQRGEYKFKLLHPESHDTIVTLSSTSKSTIATWLRVISQNQARLHLLVPSLPSTPRARPRITCTPVEEEQEDVDVVDDVNENDFSFNRSSAHLHHSTRPSPPPPPPAYTLHPTHSQQRMVEQQPTTSSRRSTPPPPYEVTEVAFYPNCEVVPVLHARPLTAHTLATVNAQFDVVQTPSVPRLSLLSSAA